MRSGPWLKLSLALAATCWASGHAAVGDVFVQLSEPLWNAVAGEFQPDSE